MNDKTYVARRFRTIRGVSITKLPSVVDVNGRVRYPSLGVLQMKPGEVFTPVCVAGGGGGSGRKTLAASSLDRCNICGWTHPFGTSCRDRIDRPTTPL